MPPEYLYNQLYPLQDRVLRLFGQVDTLFYLSYGTAVARGYCTHRFSDDLDLFVDDRYEFGAWVDQLIQALHTQPDFQTEITLRQPRRVKLNVTAAGVGVKVDLLNGEASRVGVPWPHPVLGRLDTAENLLANKVTALFYRHASKDLADIWGLCCKMGFSIQQGLADAQGKTTTEISPADLARELTSVTEADWVQVRWIEAPDVDRFIRQLKEVGQSLILR